MFSNPLHEILPADIDALVGKAKEDMVTEFKREIKAATDGDKKELLADVSSFANASGGYLIFGMATTKGVASAVTPIATTDEDALALQLRSVIRGGIEPALPFELHAVTMGTGLTVIIIRIDEGAQKPYGITFKHSGKFFSRDGNGKYQLLPHQVHQMVLDTHAGTTRIETFISRRITALDGDGGKVALWMIPKHDFLKNTQHNLHDPLLQRIELLGHGSRTPRFTSQGLLIERRGYMMEGVDSYVLFSRNGIIEAVNSYYLLPVQGQKRLPVDRSLNYERDIVEAIKSYLELYQQLQMRCPVLVKLAITNCSGAYLVGSSFHYWNNEPRPMHDNEVISELLTVTDFYQDIPTLLKPFFDRVWQGCGFPHSFNYHREGKWEPK